MNRYATIDIGSNTILLLIGNITPQNQLEVVLDMEETTRLGRGLQKGGRLDPSSVRKSISALKKFVSICHRERVKEIAAVGTNPLRMAGDSEAFIDLVRKESSISPQVIGGEKEASLSFLAVQKDPLMPRDAMVIDVGGGSTEYIFRQGGGQTHQLQTFSLPLGAVRLTEEFLSTDPPSPDEIQGLENEIAETLCRLPSAIVGDLVGLGGTAATLGSIHLEQERFYKQKVHGLQLSIGELKTQVNYLQKKDLSARTKMKGLPPERADIILAGAMIILFSMQWLKQEKIHISCHGLRYGLFYERFMS